MLKSSHSTTREECEGLSWLEDARTCCGSWTCFPRWGKIPAILGDYFYSWNVDSQGIVSLCRGFRRVFGCDKAIICPALSCVRGSRLTQGSLSFRLPRSPWMNLFLVWVRAPLFSLMFATIFEFSIVIQCYLMFVFSFWVKMEETYLIKVLKYCWFWQN